MQQYEKQVPHELPSSSYTQARPPPRTLDHDDDDANHPLALARITVLFMTLPIRNLILHELEQNSLYGWSAVRCHTVFTVTEGMLVRQPVHVCRMSSCLSICVWSSMVFHASGGALDDQFQCLVKAFGQVTLVNLICDFRRLKVDESLHRT